MKPDSEATRAGSAGDESADEGDKFVVSRLSSFFNEVKEKIMLFDYTVELIEVDIIGTGDNSILFECEAENADHAAEQALNAYPDAELLEIIREGECVYSGIVA